MDISSSSESGNAASSTIETVKSVESSNNNAMDIGASEMSQKGEKRKDYLVDDIEDGEVVEGSLLVRIERSFIYDLTHPVNAPSSTASSNSIALSSSTRLRNKNMIVLSPLENVIYSNWSNVILRTGLWLEFGVYSGKTINIMAKLARMMSQSSASENNNNSDNMLSDNEIKVYGFDSFEGLPEDWRSGFEAGTFNRKGQAPKVEDNVELVVGWFNETLEGFLSRPNAVGKHAGIIHLDADLYSSTIYVLQTLKDRIVVGTILVFDELINFKEYREGEWKALIECCASFGWRVEFLFQSGIMEIKPVIDVNNSQQVAVIVVDITADDEEM